VLGRVQVALDHGRYDSQHAQGGYLLTLSLPGEEEDSLHFDKLDSLELQELKESEDFILRSGKAPSDDMMAFLRLMNISGTCREVFPCSDMLTGADEKLKLLELSSFYVLLHMSFWMDAPRWVIFALLGKIVSDTQRN
jgi:hypothetical protein